MALNLPRTANWRPAAFAALALCGALCCSPAMACEGSTPIIYSELLTKIESGSIETAAISGSKVAVRDRQNRVFCAETSGNDTDLIRELRANNVAFEFKQPGSGIVGIVVQIFPIVLLIGAWVLFMMVMRRRNVAPLKVSLPAETDQKLAEISDRIASLERAVRDRAGPVDAQEA